MTEPLALLLISVAAWVFAMIIYGLAQRDRRAVRAARAELVAARMALQQAALAGSDNPVTRTLLNRAYVHLDKAHV